MPFRWICTIVLTMTNYKETNQAYLQEKQPFTNRGVMDLFWGNEEIMVLSLLNPLYQRTRRPCMYFMLIFFVWKCYRRWWQWKKLENHASINLSGWLFLPHVGPISARSSLSYGFGCGQRTEALFERQKRHKQCLRLDRAAILVRNGRSLWNTKQSTEMASDKPRTQIEIWRTVIGTGWSGFLFRSSPCVQVMQMRIKECKTSITIACPPRS